jgi:hypothetical protein
MDKSIRDYYSDKFTKFLTPRETQKLFVRMDRICYKIAPLNSKTGNTQTLFRWELPKDSPQYATEDECNTIFRTLCNDLLGYFGEKDVNPRKPLDGYGNGSLDPEDIKECLARSSRIGSLELPISYMSHGNSPVHRLDNIFWFKPKSNRYALEDWLNNKTIATKIQVKAFLTDRRQTGDYQTNREVRWETHPQSPQFSTRKDCGEIAQKLIAQIATFNGAPEPGADLIPLVEEALGEKFVANSFRCPISGKPIFYEDFVSKVASPVHGRSGYQVGHLNPLASTGGHIASNISWITDLGNRVQGDESLDNIVDEIFGCVNIQCVSPCG